MSDDRHHHIRRSFDGSMQEITFRRSLEGSVSASTWMDGTIELRIRAGDTQQSVRLPREAAAALASRLDPKIGDPGQARELARRVLFSIKTIRERGMRARDIDLVTMESTAQALLSGVEDTTNGQ